ncbi:MAG: DGQHR domain-containing protein, partial [Candidatus Paceibacteria bacterium]
MSKNQYKEKLIIPAIRQYMGDWVYFSASMTMKDIYDRVSVAEEIHEGSALKEKIQRDLLDEKRAPNIKKYLEEQEQRFFNSFVIGVYGGVPQWYEIEIEGEWLPHSDEKIPERLEGALGLLMLEGDEQLFAIDGQHRVAGIRKAIDDGVDIADEEVSALFVGHETSVEGRRRTRRLFTTLNRYAKPVRKHEAITLDEDDVVAISTRRIIEDQKILKDRVALNKTKSIQTSDNKNFTSLVTVYDSLDVILRDRSKSNWEDFKKIRPKEKYINEYVDRSYRFYNLIYENFEDVRKYANEEIGGEIAQPYRNSESGGHLLFRPVGLIL